MSETSIRSFRHLECQNPSIISESIGIPNGSEKTGKKVRNGGMEEHGGTERNLIHIEEDGSGCITTPKIKKTQIFVTIFSNPLLYE